MDLSFQQNPNEGTGGAPAAHCGERLCLRGLRIRVKDVLELLATGASREEILKILRFSKPSKSPWYAAPRSERVTVGSCGCSQGGWLIAINRGGKPVKLV